MGLEPGAAECKVQMKPLSYGGTHLCFIFMLQAVVVVVYAFAGDKTQFSPKLFLKIVAGNRDKVECHATYLLPTLQ